MKMENVRGGLTTLVRDQMAHWNIIPLSVCECVCLGG